MTVPDGQQFRGVNIIKLPGQYAGWKVDAPGMNLTSSNIKGIKKHINTSLEAGFQVIDGRLHKPQSE
jgi:hypothetical protein